MSIPEIVDRALSPGFIRTDASTVVDILRDLNVDSGSEFAEFYRRYRGPFGSQSLGYELLDLVEQRENILSNTQDAWDECDLRNHFLVVSTLVGMGVLVYDTRSGNVYDVDFEGGVELLDAGVLMPRWKTWNEFLLAFFG